MSHYQIKAIICLMALCLTACASQSLEKNSQSKSVKGTGSELIKQSEASSNPGKSMSVTSADEGQEKTNIMIPSDVKKPDLYFQKQPNTSVYDLQGKVVKTLRFQSFVPIFLVEDEKAYINRDNTRWVDLSTLTPNQPEISSLPEGTLSNGLETLDKDAIKDAVKNGRK